MNQSFKLKIKWFAGLFFRLALVSILGLFCAHLLSSVFLKLRFGFHVFSGLMTIAMIIGYAWAIYFNFPFFQSRTKRQRLFISTGMALIPLFIAYGCLLILAKQFFDGMQRAQFSSPANPVNQICFYDGGFMDRDLWLYAKSDGQKTQFIANIWWSPECYFSDAQWTKDGKMIVCSLNVEVASNQPIMAVAFDFSANKSIVPPWMTKISCDFKPEADWRKQETNVKKMVVAHGGLSDYRITDDTIRANEKKLWFWQTPP
jgi:hypothetical protein